MKIIIHTMDHNKHYDYFRRLISQQLSNDHQIYHLIHKDDVVIKQTFLEKIQSRLTIEKKLFKLASKNDEGFEYIKNRTKGVFFNKYKKSYDDDKLSYIDEYFENLSNNIEMPTDNVFYINNINNEEELIENLNPDLMIVVGAPFIKKHIVNLPFKKINLHIGYLPNYRGIKTIEWAILNKEFDKIGYSVHELTSELDKGGIIARNTITIDPNNYNLSSIYVTLYEKAFQNIVNLIKHNTYNNIIDKNSTTYKIYNNYKFNPLNYKKLSNRKTKMAIFAGNPVQYHVPIYKELSIQENIDLTVMYGSNIGAEKFYSKEFKSFIEWDIPLLEGYKYIFFKNFVSKNVKGTFSRINFGMFTHILKNDYDVVLIHGYDTVSSWMVFIAAKLSNTKIIWRGEAAIRPQNRQNYLKKFVKTKLLPLYFKSCDAVMYSCTGNNEYLKQFNISDDKMFLIPCSVDNKFFRLKKDEYTPQREELRNKFNISKDDFVILFTARFTTRKRPLDLINAVSKIYNKNIVILFVGDGLERENMEELLKKHNIRNEITGFIGQNELPKYYVMSDMFAIVSDYDASPKSMNEALNFELPILTTDKVGTAYDLVQNNHNGYIVESRNIDAMSKKIDYFNNNREISKAMGEKSLPISNEWTVENDVVGIQQAINFILNK